MNKKCIEILQYLIKSNDYVKVDELAQMYNVTERSIRYDIDKIEKFLCKNGFDYIERKYNVGVKINNQDNLKGFVKQFIKTPIPFKYNYSKEERLKYILLQILQSNQPVKIAHLEKKLYISKNTVLKELDRVEKWLYKRKLTLIRKPRVGIMIEGSEYDKRKAIISLVSQTVSTDDILNYAKRNIAQCRMKNIQFDALFSDIDIDFLDALIKKAELELKRRFSDESYAGLLTHLALMIKRVQLHKTIYLPKIQLGLVDMSNECGVAKIIIKEIEKKFRIIVPQEEENYIILHLLGAGVFDAGKTGNSEFEEDKICEIVSTMISEIEGIYNVDFGQEKTHIINGLIIHLRPALFRIKYDKKQFNPIFDEIKTKYSQLLMNTTYVARHIEKYIGKNIDEQEVSYIALHFGAALKNARKTEKQKTRVIIVCGSGVGTARMVASQIGSEFDVEIIDIISCRDIDAVDNKDFDFIISTVQIPYMNEKQYIRISPLLSNRDLEKLNVFLKTPYQKMKSDDHELQIVNRCMSIVEKYCTIQDKEHLKYELLYEIKNISKNIQEGRFTYMLKDLLTKDTIQLHVACKDWIEAIKAGTAVLLEKGYVEQSYEEAIIDSFKQHGPYMVVAPGIVLSHARPEHGVNTLSMSLITLKKPIKFGNETNDPVRLIITLAAIDNETHLKALAQLMELFMNEEDMNIVLHVANKEQIIKLVTKYSNQ